MAWTYTLDELARVLDVRSPAGSNALFRRISTDTRTLQSGDVFFALSGERFDGNQFVPGAFAKGATAAVTTRPVEAGPCLVVTDPLVALQRFAAYHRRRYAVPVLAVTGSCGKTTSKDLTAAVLATRYNVVKTPGNLNNDIGCPLSLLHIGDDTQFAIIEMGANHPGEIAALCQMAAPTESAITMIAPAHLEGFGSIENVAAAKGEIVEALPSNGVFYVNADDPHCVAIANRFDGQKVRFGASGDVVLESCEPIAAGEMRLHVRPVGTLRLPLACRAHVTNALLAIAVGLRHGVTAFEDPLRNALKTATRFKVLSVGPLTVIDDSYNANPASMKASLDALAEWPAEGVRFAALGEMLELGESAAALHREIGEYAGRSRVLHLFAKGPHASDMIAAGHTARIPHAEALDDPHDIAAAIHTIAQPGDVLLVKGSRGMRMENVIEALRKLYE